MEIFKKGVMEWEKGLLLKGGDWKMGKGLDGLFGIVCAEK